MKKSRLLVCLLIQLLLACGLGRNSMASEAKSLRIAMILWRGETAAEKGFRDRLKKMGYSVKYTNFSPDQNKEKLAEILRQDIGPKATDFDYIYCFGTTAAKLTKAIVGEKVPLLFNAVSTPVEAGIVKSLDVPGGNISGVTNMIPIEKQLNQARKLIPFKNLGVLYNPREMNAALRAEEVGAMSKQMHFSVVELNVSPETSQLQDTLNKIVQKEIVVDAVFLPMDSYVISQAQLIGEKLRLGKIYSIAAQKDSIIGGALLGLVPDYYEMGTLAAEIVDQHRKGRKMGDIPVGRPRTHTLCVNKKTLELLGLRLPKELAATAQLVD